MECNDVEKGVNGVEEEERWEIKLGREADDAEERGR